jgi:outer membrane protein assembly factor BamB
VTVSAGRRPTVYVAAALVLGASLLVSCVSGGQRNRRGDGFDAAKPSSGPGVAVRWSTELADSYQGAYLPVEQAAPVLDARSERVYVGSTRGALLAFDERGRQLFRYDAKAAIEAQPTVDSIRGEVYAATVTGTLIALRADDAALRWKAEAGGSITQQGLLSNDALYVVTDTDSVLAVSRADGSVLWRYHRDPLEGFGITGHAGLTMTGSKLITGFSDGMVVALDAGDGRVLWELNTSLDLEDVDPTRRFTDVDTTPAVAGNTVYVASFSGGLYAVDLGNGAIQLHRDEMQGINGLTATPDALLVSSAEHGILCLDLPGLTLRWKRAVGRGSPSKAEVRGDNVYVTESLGAFLVLALGDGAELGRLETAHGITAPATLERGRGFVLSNAGTLYAFTY